RRQAEVGIDIVDDGEQSKPGFVAYVLDRVGGFSPRDDMPDGFLRTRENQAFPEFYHSGHSGAALPRVATTTAIKYTGHKQLRDDIENLKAALKNVKVADVFMPAASPASIEAWQVNRYYKTDEECLYAIAEAMREEYEAIVAAGFMLQIDDPRLVMHYMLHPEMSIEDARRWIGSRIEALNHALRNIPPERIRHHTCYGINMGPRTNDLEFRHVVDLVLTIRANFYSFEAANPRHEHEWRVWENVKLPAGKAILPGVITQSSVLVEHPELVAERIGRFASKVGRENVIASADCGFASTPRAVPEVHPTIVWEKFRSLVEGARIATRALWSR
ncbi:MAG: 5-methyltetrahydropteroyltriglutamate--homocysteine methyltransferase, partial [Alphaproteobacteria bacterium]|nr:5-methyltetrahydropteroyltriglutamate--homocysteine methyltransferase [Alphaproteobacteria bacterium]